MWSQCYLHQCRYSTGNRFISPKSVVANIRNLDGTSPWRPLGIGLSINNNYQRTFSKISTLKTHEIHGILWCDISVSSTIAHEKKMATVTAHRELTVTKMITASREWAVTWAVIELWPSRDWAMIILKMLTASCDLAVIELWPRRDWAVT